MTTEVREVLFSNEGLLKLEVLTLDRQLFEQIVEPEVAEESQAVEAQENGFAIIIEVSESPVSLVWLLVKGKHRWWRWNVCYGYELGQALQEHPWLAQLPQIYLT